LKKLDEYRGVLEICHKKYPDFLAMERKILALEEENRKLKSENNVLTRDKLQLDSSFNN